MTGQGGWSRSRARSNSAHGVEADFGPGAKRAASARPARAASVVSGIRLTQSIVNSHGPCHASRRRQGVKDIGVRRVVPHFGDVSDGLAPSGLAAWSLLRLPKVFSINT